MEPESKHVKLNPQQIHVRDTFIETDVALQQQLWHLATQLHLQDVQIESGLLISSIRQMGRIETIDLINVTLFGGIFLEEHEKLELPNLTGFRVHLNRLHNGKDNDEAPDVLPDKMKSLLFIKPPASLAAGHVDIELKTLDEDGYWQEFFTTKNLPNGTAIVYSGLDWNEQLSQYVNLPKLANLSLHNCAVYQEFVPVQTLTSLTLSAIQIGSVQFKQLLQAAVSSSSLEELTLREHSSFNLEDLMCQTTQVSNLKRLMLMSTEIRDTPEPNARPPFPQLQSLSLIDCNLSQDFTNVFKTYFKNIPYICIQDFPLSCELLHFILQECSQTKTLQLHKFNLDSTWEAETDPENQYFTFVKGFISTIHKTPQKSNVRLSVELERDVAGVSWKCNWIKKTQLESKLGDTFESRHREITTKTFSDVGSLIVEDIESLNIQLREQKQNMAVYCQQLRIVDLYNVDFNRANLEFLAHCANLVVLQLEQMKINNMEDLSCSFLTVLSRPVFPKLQKYYLALSIPAIKQMTKEMTQQLIVSDLIWFAKNPDQTEFEFIQMFTWNKIEIVININHRIIFEMNWRTGVLNFGPNRHGSEILNNPRFMPSYTIKNLYLHDLSQPIPVALQSGLESVVILDCDVEYDRVCASIGNCERLKEFNLRDVNFVGIPSGIGFGLLKTLEKATFTKRGA